MADAVYDSMRINDDIKQLNITPIIWRSRRAKNLQKTEHLQALLLYNIKRIQAKVKQF
jgi:hypothetical protein